MIIWSPGMSLEDIEEQIIEKAYNHYSKNLEKTASSLKISLEKLQEKIKNFSKKQEEMDYTLEIEKKKYEIYLKRARGEKLSDHDNNLMRKTYEPEPIKEEKKRKLID